MIPKGLVELEKIFDRRDAFLAQSSFPKEVENDEYEKVNFGDKHNHKMVNLETYCETYEKVRFIKLLKECTDVFT